MATYLRDMLVVTACLYAIVTSVSGLQCHQCSYVSGNSDNNAFAQFLSALGTSVSSDCPGSVDSNTAGVTQVTCPDPASGNVAKCSKVVATAEFSVSAVSSTGNYYSRGCTEVSSSTGDVCVATTDSTGLTSLFTAISTSLFSVSLTSYDGTECYCSTDLCNGQGQITPPKACLVAALFLGLVWGRLW